MVDRDELIGIYDYHLEIFSRCYDMMGRLLDISSVKREVESRRLSDIYIYGGGYLGIQLYRAISPFVNVISVVDKQGKLLLDSIEDIPVVDLGAFQNQYNGQPVIITPLKFYEEIYYELKEFVAENNIIFLEEFGR